MAGVIATPILLQRFFGLLLILKAWLPDEPGRSPGPPKGNKNALKHGRYTAEAQADRRELSELLRQVKALPETGEVA